MRRVLFAAVIIIMFFGVSDLFAETKKKVIFVYSIDTADVDRKLEDVIISNIKLSIIENYGPTYNITGIDDLKIRLAQEEFRQAVACSDESCIVEIAEQCRADETIYGKVIQGTDGIRFSLTNMVVDENGKSFTKSIVMTDEFPVAQIEWYSKEAAKKLINPLYSIRKPDPDEIQAAKIELKALKSLSPDNPAAAIYTYKTEDQFLSTVLPNIKSRIREGDEFYKKGDYASAYDIYSSLFTQMEQDIPQHKRNDEINTVFSNVTDRLASALYPITVDKIEKVDAEVKTSSDLNPEKTAFFVKKYKKIEDALPVSYTNEKIDDMRKMCQDRMDQMRLFNINYYNSIALKYYETEEFSKAYSFYREADYETYILKNEKLKIREKAKAVANLEAAKINGTNYLNSRVYYLLDIALVEHWNKRPAAVRKIMKKAETIVDKNREFLTPELKKDYNKTALMVNAPMIGSNNTVSTNTLEKKIMYGWNIGYMYAQTGYVFENSETSNKYLSYDEKITTHSLTINKSFDFLQKDRETFSYCLTAGPGLILGKTFDSEGIDKNDYLYFSFAARLGIRFTFGLFGFETGYAPAFDMINYTYSNEAAVFEESIRTFSLMNFYAEVNFKYIALNVIYKTKEVEADNGNLKYDYFGIGFGIKW